MATTLIEVVASIAAWVITGVALLTTVLSHLPRIGTFLRSRDRPGLIPVWTFFAPRPGTSDEVLLYRDRLGEHETSEWMPVLSPRARAGRFLWNPGKRVSKLVTDTTSEVFTHTGTPVEELGTGYLLLARLAETAPHDWRATHFQFMVVRVGGWWMGDHVYESAYTSRMIRLR